MQVSTRAIILSSLKFGDTSLIVKAYTLSDGLKSYLLKGVLAAKKGKVKPAYFQPLMQLELIAVHRNKGALERILEAKVVYHYNTLHSDIIKSTMSLFLAEMLSNSIFEEEANEELYFFLEAALQWLDQKEEIANFHLVFMLFLTKHLGFYPDTSKIQFPYFDLVEGEFISEISLNPLIRNDNLDYFKKLLEVNFDDMHTLKMNKLRRQELLKLLILYFELHLHGFRKPKSIAILNEVFS